MESPGRGFLSNCKKLQFYSETNKKKKKNGQDLESNWDATFQWLSKLSHQSDSLELPTVGMVTLKSETCAELWAAPCLVGSVAFRGNWEECEERGPLHSSDSTGFCTGNLIRLRNKVAFMENDNEQTVLEELLFFSSWWSVVWLYVARDMYILFRGAIVAAIHRYCDH